MKNLLLIVLMFISGLSYAQNVTTIRKAKLKVFTGSYDSKKVAENEGRMTIEIRQAKTVVTGTLNYQNTDKVNSELKFTGYVQNEKVHIQLSSDATRVGSAVLTLENDILTFLMNGNSDILPKKATLASK
ncbi:hypothetical protein [Flavobacterium pallidum]|nr:hypothetical protein [Flavobacterium pallidum]